MVISTRLKALAATGVLAGGIGMAAINGAFAASPLAPAAASPVATTVATPTATAGAATSPSGTPPAGAPAGTRTPGSREGKGGGFFGGGFFGSSFSSVATFLGISTTDLQTALRNGQTLAQIAQAHGKTSADLKNFLLTQDGARIDKLLTTNFQQAFSQRPPGGPGFAGFSGVATFLGMSQTDLQTALKGGQTLAQVAQAHGKSAADLKTYLTSQLKTRLDQAVSAGRLTSQQETDQLNQASTRIDQLINSTGPQFGHFPGRGGPEPSGTPKPAATTTSG
jgi:hypothetical protein